MIWRPYYEAPDWKEQEQGYDKDLNERFNVEFDSLINKPSITLLISTLQIWVIFSQLQLALRHPSNTGPTSEIARDIALQLQEIVAGEGTLNEVAVMGWDEHYDE